MAPMYEVVYDAALKHVMAVMVTSFQVFVPFMNHPSVSLVLLHVLLVLCSILAVT